MGRSNRSLPRPAQALRRLELTDAERDLISQIKDTDGERLAAIEVRHMRPDCTPREALITVLALRGEDVFELLPTTLSVRTQLAPTETTDAVTDEHTMPTPARFRAAGDRAAARLRKRAEWAAVAAQRRDAHDRAYEQWITGALAPYRITRALDAAELYGPDVNIACGAQEPAVDERRRHPLPLIRAAPRPGRADPPIPGLVHRTRRRRGPRPRDTTMSCHISKAERARWRPPITEFTAAAVEECPGTNDYRATRLF
ncbi:hypothetical protein GCM10020255_004880 [Rhodococcus baikonurensis]